MTEPKNENENIINEKDDLEFVAEDDLVAANGGRGRAGLARQAYRWATSGEGRKFFRRGAAAGAGFETGRRAVQHVGGGRRDE
jgi:hypothetical protein